MSLQKFLDNILKDLKVDLTDDFDRNFERKAFFDKAWPRNKLVNRRRPQMARTNNLRRPIMSKIQRTEIVFSSSLPYAKISLSLMVGTRGQVHSHCCPMSMTIC